MRLPQIASPGSKDVATLVVPEYAQSWDRAVERRVVRKIDMLLLPFMWIGYGLVYYDKAILGSGAVLGMTTDLSLKVIDKSTIPPTVSTKRLSWATSLFYFGMLAGLYPFTYLFQRFRLGRVLGCTVICWGAIAMLTAAVTSWRGLFAQRFFLGFTESIIPTAFMVITSGYYTQSEQTMRQCLWYSTTGGWTIIGAAINYGFAKIDPDAPLARWQYLYLLAGGLTILFGILCFFIPDSPVSAWFFTEKEKFVAVERLRMSQTGLRCQSVKWSQIREALLDIKVWTLAVMMGAAYCVNGAVSGFGPLIVSTFGYTAAQSILWQMPLGAVCFVTILIVGYASRYIPNIRLFMLIFCCLPVIAGCAMIWRGTWSYHAPTPVAGYTIIGFFAPVTSLIVSMGMANVAGASKKSFMAAAIFVFYCVGNIVGPQLVFSNTIDRHYPALWLGIIICYCIVIALAILLYILLRLENKKRNSLQLDEKEAERMAFEDRTDKQNPHFRYVM
ncbi:MFS general substrate transporter [Xylona heveae TC161]|uniref:MFS general substrate transporter n=1 Tax=Xylona heveae (strain CBS 132557 / TC161) TaxID=1328760 RepID=A0A165G1C6_XYLHT|nr:MFS general substrate transporter [Xylona heveae TC161]KZF21625.1 MFS general substrate transporter [Xylona heveae TC161]